MSDEREYIEFEDCKLIRQTDKAALVRLEDGTEHWFPWSQISEDSEIQKDGDTGIAYFTEWILQQKEIDY